MKLDRCVFRLLWLSSLLTLISLFFTTSTATTINTTVVITLTCHCYLHYDHLHPFSNRSGSIDREEFLQIPQIATNPLASRMIAIFDEE